MIVAETGNVYQKINVNVINTIQVFRVIKKEYLSVQKIVMEKMVFVIQVILKKMTNVSVNWVGWGKRVIQQKFLFAQKIVMEMEMENVKWMILVSVTQGLQARSMWFVKISKQKINVKIGQIEGGIVKIRI